VDRTVITFKALTGIFRHIKQWLWKQCYCVHCEVFSQDQWR